MCSVETIWPIDGAVAITNASTETKLVAVLPGTTRALKKEKGPTSVVRTHLNRTARVARRSLQLLANAALRSEVGTQRVLCDVSPAPRTTTPAVSSLVYAPSAEPRRPRAICPKKRASIARVRFAGISMQTLDASLSSSGTTQAASIVDRSATRVAASRCVNVAYALYGQHFPTALERGAVLPGDYVVVHVASNKSAARRKAPSDAETSGETKRQKGFESRSCSSSSSSKEAALVVRASGSGVASDGVKNGSWAVARVTSVDVDQGVAALRAVRYHIQGQGKRLSGPPQLVGAPVSVPLAACQWHLGVRFPTSRAEISRHCDRSVFRVHTRRRLHTVLSRPGQWTNASRTVQRTRSHTRRARILESCAAWYAHARHAGADRLTEPLVYTSYHTKKTSFLSHSLSAIFNIVFACVYVATVKTCFALFPPRLRQQPDVRLEEGNVCKKKIFLTLSKKKKEDSLLRRYRRVPT